ncbi:MAG: hypothetical protein PHH47_13760 [Gallionella sp.]|nr:hypothetical protein [Gallionella sp.]MDD4947369.1 hypothetical protein [Gallionella sp.]
MKPFDGFPLHLSELQAAGKVSDAFTAITRDLAETIAERSCGRYMLETDFRTYPQCVFSYSKVRDGGKVLSIVFDAYPANDEFSRPQGVSVGLGFHYGNENLEVADCANEFEAYMRAIFVEKALFNATFGRLIEHEMSDEDVYETAKQISPGHPLSYLFFGKRIASDAVATIGTLDDFADECIRVFDVICGAGYFQLANEMQ